MQKKNNHIEKTGLPACPECVDAANQGTQIIVNTCHAPERLPEGWNIVKIDDNEPSNVES
ncbi:hypothetical protein [Desulfovibrio inopinatus]|uniref:hypothetical protein n=1 Tax=Desulfovibrio inopinatus TaxID=102109 RepID=UPI00041733BB|nr:hypothetical protein [Desulfovibrio inopinatus]